MSGHGRPTGIRAVFSSYDRFGECYVDSGVNLTLQRDSGQREHVVLVSSTGEAYRPGDVLPSGERAFVWVAHNVKAEDPLREQFLRQYALEMFSPYVNLGAENEEKNGEDQEAALL